MVDLVKEEALAHGDKLKIISVERLKDLKNEIGIFSNTEDLNGFQKWIVGNIYDFDVPTADFEVKSVILVANPHPSYAKVEFERKGRTYHFKSLVMSDFSSTEKYLKELLASIDHHMQPVWKLPFKRLAAQTGLAAYGRNNICYVEGMGSFFSFAGYFSDIECNADDWQEMSHAEECANCRVCINNCPTGAIREERFLIDNERCLSYFNENPGAIPDWIPQSAHHCLYDCLKCQIICPINKKYVNNIMDTVIFNEEETEQLLVGSPMETFTPALMQKAKLLGLD